MSELKDFLVKTVEVECPDCRRMIEVLAETKMPFTCGCCLLDALTKKFIAIPACPDINFNPKTHGKSLQVANAVVCNTCKKVVAVVDDYSECYDCSMRTNRRANDSNYYRIIIAASVLITIGYAYLIWCLL